MTEPQKTNSMPKRPRPEDSESVCPSCSEEVSDEGVECSGVAAGSTTNVLR